MSTPKDAFESLLKAAHAAAEFSAETFKADQATQWKAEATNALQAATAALRAAKELKPQAFNYTE